MRLCGSVLVLLLVGVVSVSASNLLRADNTHNDLPVPLPVVITPPVWEYNFVSVDDPNYPDQLSPSSEASHETGFNIEGAAGWEYVGFWPHGSNAKYYAIFKRIKP